MRRTVIAGIAALLAFLSLLAGPASATTPDASAAGWGPVDVLASYDVSLDVTPADMASDASGHVYATWRAIDLHDRDPNLAMLSVRDPATGDWSEPAAFGGTWWVRRTRLVTLPDGGMVAVFSAIRPRHKNIWGAGFQVVNADGSLGPSDIRRLPKFYDPYLLSPSVASDGDLTIAMTGTSRHIIVLRSSSLGALKKLDVPPIEGGGGITDILVDQSLHVTAVTQHYPRHERFGNIRVWELNAGSWTSHVLDDQVTHAADRVVVGRDGNAAMTWYSNGHVVVGARISGTWTVDAFDQTATVCSLKFDDCSVVGIADDNEVVASWVRDGSDGGFDAVLARRDPITGTWSAPDVFEPDTDRDARWYLEVGAGGDAIIWWPPSVPALYQCERGASCSALSALAPAEYRGYADAAGSDLVTYYVSSTGRQVLASTYHE